MEELLPSCASKLHLISFLPAGSHFVKVEETPRVNSVVWKMFRARFASVLFTVLCAEPSTVPVRDGGFLSVCSNALMHRFKIIWMENGECLKTGGTPIWKKGKWRQNSLSIKPLSPSASGV